jgi:hypothetical protein
MSRTDIGPPEHNSWQLTGRLAVRLLRKNLRAGRRMLTLFEDLGYMINHAMYQRNGRAGYVLKPLALRVTEKELLHKRTKHFFDITVRVMHHF